MFSKPVGDIEKSLSKIPKLPTSKIVENIREVTSINEKRFDIADYTNYATVI